MYETLRLLQWCTKNVKSVHVSTCGLTPVVRLNICIHTYHMQNATECRRNQLRDLHLFNVYTTRQHDTHIHTPRTTTKEAKTIWTFKHLYILTYYILCWMGAWRGWTTRVCGVYTYVRTHIHTHSHMYANNSRDLNKCSCSSDVGMRTHTRCRRRQLSELARTHEHTLRHTTLYPNQTERKW